MATIFQINTSAGGVPKHGQVAAEVETSGLVGDAHRYHGHGGPQRAVCLYSLERIQALQIEGHPVFPGALGENLTISGLEWESVVPSTRLQIGQDVILEITEFTTPCKNLVPFFMNGDFNRVGQDNQPGWSRVYARVLQRGTIQVTDQVQKI
jgi:MOSC domain-containing protein YiiM